MRSQEHRAIGEEATGGALVNLGGDSADERFLLTYGDVVALAGDYFRPDGSRRARPSDALFTAAATPGPREEIVCALKVMSADEGFVDPRFEPGGQFARYGFTARADRTDVERRVRDRYLSLAASNDDHFVSPGRSDIQTASGFPAAPAAYRALHQRALDEAWRLGRVGGDLSRAMAREAAAQHYLTDAFASGHLRTPVADIRRYWHARYPRFWERLQHRVSSDTAAALREVSALLRLVPRRLLDERVDSELRTRTGQYPELSLGDLVARAFHDWDNDHGLRVDGGMIFGDGHVDEGVTKDLALAAVRAGIDDVEVAFELGRTGRSAPGPALYEEVRRSRTFGAEQWIPEIADTNPAQNWMAPDVETLWESPMVGTSGPTVGDAVADMLRPDGEFVRQLQSLGEGLAGTHGVLALPVIGGWLAGRCCHAYRRGFVEPLARDPRPVVLALTEGEVGHGQPVAAMAAVSL